jgi:hypothetical protein
MMTSYYSKHANLLQKYQMRLSQQIFPGKEEKKKITIFFPEMHKQRGKAALFVKSFTAS